MRSSPCGATVVGSGRDGSAGAAPARSDGAGAVDTGATSPPAGTLVESPVGRGSDVTADVAGDVTGVSALAAGAPDEAPASGLVASVGGVPADSSDGRAPSGAHGNGNAPDGLAATTTTPRPMSVVTILRCEGFMTGSAPREGRGVNRTPRTTSEGNRDCTEADALTTP